VIELIEGLPDGVVGLEAVGEVSSDDYATVANPAVERALAQRGKIRLLHVLGDRFTGYTGGGMWDDAKSGSRTRAPGSESPWSRTSSGFVGSRRPQDGPFPGDEAVPECGARRGGGVGERRVDAINANALA
jgi:hypothetical protein